ncbi:hypothetical protein RJ639_013392 [Escallonia herrerae]|uniref:DUF4378 domain-containing protein n=1 Tax=Escallonia herrerae TaxID=1293975 RepID=A0AA88VH21_9ASTE|nr:hypothetical protein RJ639_013392 [Escallonia herrerae]
MDEDKIATGSSIKEDSDYSCASSVTDDEVCGSKAPGVVARLMGLDSLPRPNPAEGYSTPLFDSQSLQDAPYRRKTLEFHHDHEIMHSGNLHHKVEAPDRNAIEPKPQKIINRPIEKFQTESLPPRSAKSIPITQHKLLSPIKSPSFIPSQNAAHIMEAAARIIEPGQGATAKARMPLLGSSSAPLKVRDLKEKAETAKRPSKLAEVSQRPGESNAAKCLKGQSMNKSWNGSVETKSFRLSSDLEEYSVGAKNTGKSISLALQAKVNVQKREGLNPSRKSLFGQKEQNEVMSSQVFNSQPNTRRSMHKKPSAHDASNVLKQNNQKQNCLPDRGKLPSKSVASNSQVSKPLLGDSSVGRHKSTIKCSGNSKVGARKSVLEVTENKKDVPHSSTKTVASKKRSIDGDFHLEKYLVVDNTDRRGKAFQSNALMDRQFSWVEDSKSKGMDVISFAFTAPMARSVSVPVTPREVVVKNNAFPADFRSKRMLLSPDGTNGSKLSSLGYNVIGGDALSTLLEQKLRELTHGVESSRHKAGTAGNSASIFQDMIPALKAPTFDDKRSQEWIHTEKSSSNCDTRFSSSDPQGLRGKQKTESMEELNECGSNESEARKLLDCRYPSPISVLEPSFFTESCNSSDTIDSNSTEGSKQCSSVLAREVFGTSSSTTFDFMEADADLSDSATSTSSKPLVGKHVTDFVGSTRWELEYVKEILSNVEWVFNSFSSGRSSEIINPHLFDQLESRRGVPACHTDEPKLRRKALFDCVGECLDMRFRQYVGGGCRSWVKGLSVVRRKDWLAEEVYKQISGWKRMGTYMVDELVDKDMSSQYGGWLDYEVQAFELGVEVERRILNSLVNEVVADILLL